MSSMTRMNWDCYSEQAAPYFNFARSHNSLQHSGKRADKARYSLAKPVLMFDADSSDMQWRLRTHVATAQQCVETSLAALAPPAGLTRIQVPLLTAPRPRPAWTQTKASLTEAVNRLVALYEGLHDAGDHRRVLRALHQLQIYMTGLTLVVDAEGSTVEGGAQARGAAAHESRAENDGARRLCLDTATLANYIEFFAQVHGHVAAAQATPLPPQDTAAILVRLKQLTRFFRQASLSLSDISVKLATKPSTYNKTRAELIERLTMLTHDGLAALTRETPLPLVHQFICAFVHASRFWRGAITGRVQDGALNDVLDKVVRQLSAIESPGHYPVVHLFKHLHMRALEQREENLAHTLELLLLNETFQRYLAEKIVDADEDAIVDASLNSLLRGPNEALWQAAASGLIFRPLDAFTAVVDDMLENPLGPERINEIFDRLNAQLGRMRSAGAPDLYTSESLAVQARYRNLMRCLARHNALRLLAEHPRTASEQQQIADNLQAMHAGLHFDDLRLPTLFSNAAFWARAYSDSEPACIWAKDQTR
jgi:hypothetical protein